MEEFEAKRSALFACLDNASKELVGTALDQSGSCTAVELVYRSNTARKRNKSLSASPDRSLSRMRGKESIFKKPEMPLSRCLKPRKTPDFKLNPHKWTKYSLSDVDTSDHTNTSAALQFLSQMDERRDDSQNSDNVAPTEHTKFEFKKLSKIKRQLRELDEKEVKDMEVDTPKLKGSKLVMPEYVIGQKDMRKQKQKCNKNPKERAAGTLKLDHLQADDEDIE